MVMKPSENEGYAAHLYRYDRVSSAGASAERKRTKGPPVHLLKIPPNDTPNHLNAHIQSPYKNAIATPDLLHALA